MLAFSFAVVLALVLLFSISLNKTYRHVTVKEARRQARRGDREGIKLYKALCFGAELEVFLWLIIILSAAGSVVLFATAVPTSFAFLLTLLILGLGFWWLPVSRVSSFGGHMATWVAPTIAKLLFYLHPILRGVSKAMHRYYPVQVHAGLYEKEDLIELLEHQAHLATNRIPLDELEVAKRALQFGDHRIHDIAMTKRKITAVDANGTIGPVLIDELHKSGVGYFPVYEGKRDHIVGTLSLRDLTDLKHGGAVAEAMHEEVYYVHEGWPLFMVWEAFLRTKQHLFVVVNDTTETVGVVSIEDTLAQLLAAEPREHFDSYDNLEAVATSLTEPDEAPLEPEEPPMTEEPEA